MADIDHLTQAPIVTQAGWPHPAFQRQWQKMVQTLQDQITDLTEITDALAEQLALITEGARETARINSYTAPTNVLSAADVGATATITVAAHTRVYPVQGTVDVADLVIPAPADITGLAFTTEYHVYYDDTTLADTTPTYVSTTTRATAQVGAAAGRHFVGTITTPADGGGGTGGVGGLPPGGGGGGYIP